MGKTLQLTSKQINRQAEENNNDKLVRNVTKKTAWKDKVVLQPGMLNTKSKEETWEFLKLKGFIDDNRLDLMKQKDIKNCWENEPCYIIGAGPPLKDFVDEYGWGFFDYRHTIGINHVIEDYDALEWFFFLDRRFLMKTTYNLNNFKGHIFAQNNTGMKSNEKTTLFLCNNKLPQEKLENGLFSSNFGGLASLNLALITGANPIYLIGFGMGTNGNPNGYHYKKDYTGEIKNQERFRKFSRVLKHYEKFKKYKNRIVHVTNGNDMKTFNKVKIKDFRKFIDKRKERFKIIQNPKIVHFSFTSDLNKHADITREVFKGCIGEHIMLDQSQPIPKADLYILEHFQSTNLFCKKFPYKDKAIDIVHTVGCLPDNGFRKVIALTNAWKNYLKRYLIQEGRIEVINIGLDLEPYRDILPDYDKKVFGRITRWSPAKVHPQWSNMSKNILDQFPDSHCLIYTQTKKHGSRPLLQHPRMTFSDACKIHMFKGNFLKNMSIYIHANGSFIDTFSHSTLEAMATGLPVVLLDDKVGSVKEVVGNAGIVCQSLHEVKIKTMELLRDKDMREEYGMKSKRRAMHFSKERMISEYNEVIRQCLRV